MGCCSLCIVVTRQVWDVASHIVWIQCDSTSYHETLENPEKRRLYFKVTKYTHSVCRLCVWLNRECVCILFHLSKVLTHIHVSLCSAALAEKCKFYNSDSRVFQINLNSNPYSNNYKLCAGSASQLTCHCLGSHPHSSLLITNEPAPASRFLRRLPVLPHLCHLLSASRFSSFYLV